MSQIIDKFGRLVDRQVSTGHPKRALRLLRLAYASFGTYQKHFPSKQLAPSRQMMATLSMNYIRTPLAHPERTAIVNFFMPCQMLHAMNIHSQVAEGMSCYITGASAQQAFLEQAGAQGAPETLCSYHRILTGMALSDTLPAPRFIANTSLVCDANTVTFRVLAEHYGVPHFTIDVPNSAGPDELAYVTRQMVELKGFIEDAMHERLDEDKLKASMALSNKSLATYRRYLDLLGDIALKNDQTSEMYTVLASHLMLGTPQSDAFFTQLEADAKAAPRTAGLPAGKRPRRILWAHVIPYYQKPVRDFFAPNPDGTYDNQLLCCDMTIDALDDLDPERPYESMARRLLTDSFNGPAERRCGRIIEYARKLNAEGIIYFCHWGCRNTAGAAPLMSDLADEAGIPLLVLDGDGCDPGNTSDGQVATRLEAFAELIDAQRRRNHA